MIAKLTGTLDSHTPDGAIIEVEGIGYEVIGQWLGKHPLGKKIEVFTYNYLENQVVPRLIACESMQAKNLLLELISVSGVGPKLGRKILDSISPQELMTAITSQDLDTLTSIKGLGKKTAQKIILELGKTLVETTTSAHTYIYDALRELSFEKREIEQAIVSLDLTGLSESQALGEVLKKLGRAK